MINGINGIDIVAGDKTFASPAKQIAGQGGNFSEMLSNAVSKISELEQDSAAKQLSFSRGENVELHEVVIAMEKASIAMELVMALRNKIVDAYQEIMRMNV